VESKYITGTEFRLLSAIALCNKERSLLEWICFLMYAADDSRDDHDSPRGCLKTPQILHRERETTQSGRVCTYRYC
jgi:hypothetical protein